MALLISASVSFSDVRDDCLNYIKDKRNGKVSSQSAAWGRIEPYAMSNYGVSGLNHFAPTDVCIPIITKEIVSISQFGSWVRKNFSTESQIKEFRKRGNLSHRAYRKWGNVFYNSSGQTALQIVGMASSSQSVTNVKTKTKSAKNSPNLKEVFSDLSTLERKQMQYALKKLGYYQSTVDGIWGGKTNAALSSFIRSERIKSRNALFNLTEMVNVPSSFAEKTTGNKNKLVCKIVDPEVFDRIEKRGGRLSGQFSRTNLRTITLLDDFLIYGKYKVHQFDGGWRVEGSGAHANWLYVYDDNKREIGWVRASLCVKCSWPSINPWHVDLHYTCK